MIAHIRVIVPLTTSPNRTIMRLLNSLYPDRVVGSREYGDHTTAWLRLPPLGSGLDGDVAEAVRNALAASGVSDGVQVAPYQPRNDHRGNGRGSPWRGRREVIPTRPKGGPTP